MADLTVTAANVQHATGADLVHGSIAGEAILAGHSVYRHADGNLRMAQNDGTAAEAAAIGIAVSSAPGAGQPISYQKGGNLDLGATLVVGETYYVGGGFGGICPSADITSTKRVTLLGVATSAGNLKMSLNVSGVQRA